MFEKIFRGKRIDNDEWVFGDLIQLYDGRKFIINNKHGACIDDKGNFINTEAPFVCQVFDDSVGQYTGLTDKNGTKIFEDDIIQLGHYIGLVKYSELFGKYTATYNQISGNWFDFESDSCYPLSLECEVIGNIHNDSELLKEGADNG